MTTRFREAAWIFGAMTLLLGTAGCVSETGSQEQSTSSDDGAEEVAVASAAQPLWRAECINRCESDYNDAYYACQIQPGSGFYCYMYAQMHLDSCLNGCPPECDPTHLQCMNYCDGMHPQLQEPCWDECIDTYCG